jgi:hypothetical protein
MKMNKEVFIDGVKFVPEVYNKTYNQSEVDAVEEKAFNAAKCGIVIKRANLTGSFSCNDITPVTTYQDYKNNPNYKDYLSSLNLNTNDTGKEFVRQSKPMEEKDVVCPPYSLKFIETDSKLLESTAAKYEDWYYMPFWFQKIKHGIYKTYSINELPERLKEDLLQLRGEQPTKAPEPSALPTKEWEIAQYRNKTNGEIFELASVWNNSYYKDGFKNRTGGFGEQQDVFDIHSVIRLSDNVVFSVGEKVEYGAFSLVIADAMKLKETTIASFKINEGNIWAYGDNFFIAPLNHLRKPTPTQPVVEDKPVLFTTEDKVEIKIGDDYWVWDFGELNNIHKVNKASQTHKGNGVDRKYFSTKEAAEQYILENKPCLSLNDVFQCSSWYAGNGVNQQNKFFKADLIKAVKQKLNK